MVHNDLCSAVYDGSALDKARPEGEPVSLKEFCTPEYALVPIDDKALRHKFAMKAFLSKRSQDSERERGMTGNAVCTRIVLQPISFRHFWCYHRDGASLIEVTLLATFTERYPFIGGMPRKIDAMIQSIQHDIILQLPIG
jgi:hypothetical protein